MNQQKAYILILDDDNNGLYFLKKIIEMEDNVVPVSATTGEEALQLLEEREYALAIVDIQLPGINGFEVIRQMRESENLRDIPILIVTAFSKDSESVAKGYELGVADYIFKPLNAEILRSKVTLFTKLYFNHKTLEKSERLLREAQKMAKVGSWEFNIYKGEIWGSDESFHIYGMTPPPSNLLPIDEIEACIPEKERVRQALVDLINKDKSYELEFVIQPVDGSDSKWISSKASLERDTAGSPLRVTGVIQDVTERKLGEVAIQDSENRLRIAAEAGGLGLWDWRVDLDRAIVSDHWLKIKGISRDVYNESVDQWVDGIHPDDKERATALLDKHLKGESELFEADYRFMRPNHGWYWEHASARVIERDSEGKPIRMVGCHQDISEQMLKVELIEQAREKYRQLYGSIRDAILIADTERRIIDMNQAFCDLFGYSLEDLSGKKTLTIYKNESEFIRLGELIKQNDNPQESVVYTIQYRKKSGEVFSGETAVFKILDAKGNMTGVMGLIRDVSEKESLEQQLAYAHKLEAIGQLAAGVAHEINTPIMYMSGNMQFLKDSFESMSQLLEKQKELYVSVKNNQDISSLLPGIEEAMERLQLDYLLEETPRAIAQSQEGANRVSHIVQAMKQFSHMNTSTMVPMDINDAVENTITIASNEWKYDSEIVTDLAKDLPLIEGVLGDLNQVILNMLVNAAHANSDMVKKNGCKGIISISTTLDGDFVKICISDTGTGISPEIQHRIFDPFFTTKEVGKGTGQGLSITHTIVQKHGGTIMFTSEENKGTTFLLRFPIKQKPRNKNDA